MHFLPPVTQGLGRAAPRQQPAATRGFTLIELMVVLVVLAILIVVAAPGFKDLIVATRIKNASFDVFSSLIFARSEAVTRNTAVTITPTGGDWANGWSIADSGGTVVRRQDAFPNLTIAGPATLTFNGMGRVTGATNPTIGVTAAGVDAAKSRCITVDLGGRPVTKTGACA